MGRYSWPPVVLSRQVGYTTEAVGPRAAVDPTKRPNRVTTATSNARHGGIKSPSRRTRLIGNDKESDVMIQRLYVQTTDRNLHQGTSAYDD